MGGGVPHVDLAYLGQRSCLNPLGQLQEGALVPLHVVVRLEGGRCGAENDDRLLPLPSNQGQISGIVSDAILLFVRRIVFLVHDDDTQVLERRKDGGAGGTRLCEERSDEAIQIGA